MWNWIIERGTESSTWKGVTVALTGLGLWQLSPSVETAVIAAGTSLFGLIDAIRSERKSQG